MDWAAAESDGANMEHAAASESQVGGSKCFVLIILRSSTPFKPGIVASMITRNANWNTNWMHQQMAEPTRLLLKTILPVIGRSGTAERVELEITIRSANERGAGPGRVSEAAARYRSNSPIQSVAEMANAGKDHGHAEFVGCGDHVLILY